MPLALEVSKKFPFRYPGHGSFIGGKVKKTQAEYRCWSQRGAIIANSNGRRQGFDKYVALPADKVHVLRSEAPNRSPSPFGRL